MQSVYVMHNKFILPKQQVWNLFIVERLSDSQKGTDSFALVKDRLWKDWRAIHILL
jgi:hypothetical protein